jgi:5'-nucleotidase
MRFPYFLAAVTVALLALPAAAGARAAGVDVQLLSFNDFHGAIEPPSGSAGRVTVNPGDVTQVNAGGAAFLATHVENYRKDNPNTLLLSAGDLIGASPLLSALFHDEPTIEAMNKIGLDYNAVGNHEFDEGAAELARMQAGGCHPVDGCVGKDEFGGAEFGFLSANVVNKDTGEPLFPAYSIEEFGGVKIGFIGLTLEATPSIVSPAGIRDYLFLDEADTINRYTKELRNQHGVKAVVVLLHEGGTQDFAFPRNPAAVGINTCDDFGGPIVDIVNRTTDQVDLFLTGHTHQPYNCVIDERPVTSAMSNGRLITDVDMRLNRSSRDVSQVSVDNEVITRTVAKNQEIEDLIAFYKELSAPFASRIIGQLGETITVPSTATPAAPSGEFPMGLVIGDAMLAATDAQLGAVAGFMNPGGVRAPLTFDGDEDPPNITYEEAFNVQPFGNNLVTLTLTGDQLLLLLEQQWCGQTGTSPRIMQPSFNVSYTWDRSLAEAAFRQPCEAVESPVSNVEIGGVAVDPAGSYRITVNSFMADGGDDYRVLTQATDRVGGVVDLDALESYLQGLPGPLEAPETNRIAVVD